MSRLLLLLLLPLPAAAETFHVGPDHDLKTPDAAPWSRLRPGDEVVIHWRPEPYRCR